MMDWASKSKIQMNVKIPRKIAGLPDILNRSIVEDRADPQNVFTAIKFFSLPVQCYMLSKGYAGTAHFIQLIRNWFRACNE